MESDKQEYKKSSLIIEKELECSKKKQELEMTELQECSVTLLEKKDSDQNEKPADVKPEKGTCPLLNDIKNSLKKVRGYIFGLLFAFSMCMANILIKMSPSLDGSNHSAVRYTIQILVMAYFIKRNKLEFFGPKSHRKLLIFRGVIGSTAVIMSFFSIRYLDVSDVETLTNSCVIITAIFSRIFLKEKLTFCHIIALILTITGVFFIIRPSFLFGFEENLEHFFNVNLTSTHHVLGDVNSTLNHHKLLEIKDHNNREFIETIIGVTMVLISATCMSAAQVSIRKLCLGKVHFSITSVYPAMIGLPCSLLISFVLIETNTSHKDLVEEADILPLQIFYSICAGILGTCGIIFLNKGLHYEDATKIGMVKTMGVFFSFILQYLLLDITVDFLGILGAIFVVTGTISVMAIKLFETRLMESKNVVLRFLAFKF